MTKTAIDWYIEQIGIYAYKAYLNEITVDEFHVKKAELQKQAKEMEKQQMIDAAVQVGINHYNIFTESGILSLVNRSEQYYKETYGDEESKTTTPKSLFDTVDYKLLGEQKGVLIELMNRDITKTQHDAIAGVINLLDAFQDEAVDVHGKLEKEVFQSHEKKSLTP